MIDLENNKLLEFALTEQETGQLRIKIEKSYRTRKDRTFIWELMQDKIVLTVEPVNEEFRKRFSLEGMLCSGDYLIECALYPHA